jgi:hypothetical protein
MYQQHRRVLILTEYEDEYFHIPQAQKYCKGDYSWDPKITTPPGLYDRLQHPLAEHD